MFNQVQAISSCSKVGRNPTTAFTIKTITSVATTDMTMVKPIALTLFDPQRAVVDNFAQLIGGCSRTTQVCIGGFGSEDASQDCTECTTSRVNTESVQASSYLKALLITVQNR